MERGALWERCVSPGEAWPLIKAFRFGGREGDSEEEVVVSWAPKAEAPSGLTPTLWSHF